MNRNILIFSDLSAGQSCIYDRARIRLWGKIHSARGNPFDFIKIRFLENGYLKDKEAIAQELRSISGNFSFIIEDKNNKVLACVDKIRSYPLLYRCCNGSLTIISSPCEIKGNADLKKDQVSFLEFKMAGYVTGRDTLFEGVSQLQAGEFLHFDGKTLDVKVYYRFYEPHSVYYSQEKFIDVLHQITCSIFNKLIDRLAGRPVLVPLSAGLDSRLVVCMFKLLGYKKIRTFSYGISGNWEARWASLIAKKLGVEWFFVPYSRKLGRDFFHSQECRQYFSFSHAASTTSFILDFPALWYLDRIHKLPTEAVIVNGQSGDFITGNHVPKAFNKDRITTEDFLEVIIKKHYSLWTHLHSADNLRIIKAKIINTLSIDEHSCMDKEQAMKTYEMWECRERQSKYVVNGQRAYDFFNLSWELPLWDDEYLCFWSSVPFKYRFKQFLYKEYLKTFDFFKLFKDVNFYRYNSPTYINSLRYIFWIFGKKRFFYRKMFLSYWQDYSYYYALYPYFEYLKYAKYHRNAISYHVKEYLNKQYGEEL